MVKKFSDWSGSGLVLDEFLNDGDEIDTEMVDYFISVLPPATLQANLIQMGEPYSHDIAGNPVYSTIFREGGTTKWIYAGHLPMPPEIDYEFLYNKFLTEG